MHDKILLKLNDIERIYNVKILHAVESGSRAWGFASKDSDYDVRFIYVRPMEHYLALQKTTDVLNCELNDIFDINGWDIQKVLRLVYKSNPTIFEWSLSPIVYKTTPEFVTIKDTIFNYFSCKSGLYHYLNTAKSNYREFLKGESVRLKKYFYIVRPLLACRWILDRKSPPPMLFSELVDAELPAYMKPYIDYLLEVKINSSESEYGNKIHEVNEYIESEFVTISELISQLPNEEHNSWEMLNQLFLNIIKNFAEH
ncbi:MAG: nucleotidyltransferase domain-containing protein [Ruminococcus sp.]|nr:nucleotidyltransferase domain-containing protein [Ruminococcus sp.]